MVKKALWQRVAVIGVGVFLLVASIVLRITLVGFMGIVIVIVGIFGALKWMWQHDGEGNSGGQ